MKVCRYVCVLIVILIMSIFTMSEGSRKIKIGYDIMKMESEIAGLTEERKKLILKSDKLKKPKKISMKVADMDLGLIIREVEDIEVAKRSRKHLSKKLPGKIEA